MNRHFIWSHPKGHEQYGSSVFNFGLYAHLLVTIPSQNVWDNHALLLSLHLSSHQTPRANLTPFPLPHFAPLQRSASPNIWRFCVPSHSLLFNWKKGKSSYLILSILWWVTRIKFARSVIRYWEGFFLKYQALVKVVPFYSSANSIIAIF